MSIGLELWRVREAGGCQRHSPDHKHSWSQCESSGTAEVDWQLWGRCPGSLREQAFQKRLQREGAFLFLSSCYQADPHSTLETHLCCGERLSCSGGRMFVRKHFMKLPALGSCAHSCAWETGGPARRERGVLVASPGLLCTHFSTPVLPE